LRWIKQVPGRRADLAANNNPRSEDPMRRNLPVTQVEHAFPRGQALVSVTDVQGRITYCNAAFIATCGFSRDELLGQPHNLVRHPDMPAEAFRDLWATIAAGRPWSGLVKNRHKDGGHYWVKANATPLRDGARVAGYLSVRTEPTREEVAAAEVLYAALREDAEARRPRWRLVEGRLQRRGAWRGPLRRAACHPVLPLAAAQAAGMAALLAADGASRPLAWGLLLPLSVAASALALRPLLRSLARTAADALQLAAGDLSHEVQAGASGPLGALQCALRQVAVNLRGAVQDTRHQVAQVDLAARDLSSASQDLSARTGAQASSLQQTAASMEEIHGTVAQTAQAAVDGATLAHATADVAQAGHAAV
jgi:aerotaxis receptor